MKGNVRHSEFLFLRALVNRPDVYYHFDRYDPLQPQTVGLDVNAFSDMVCRLLEDSCVEFAPLPPQPCNLDIPRGAIRTVFVSEPRPMWITDRGRQRIEELRELLRGDGMDGLD